MALDEVGVKFVVQGLDQFRTDLKKAADAEHDVGDAAQDAAKKQKAALDQMQTDATQKSEKIGKAIAGIGVALAGVAVAGGLAALKLASDLDGAYDSIQIKTGETGVKLGDLKTSFENVFSDVPSSAQDVADAIGTLNQKLDLTGQPLEDVATRVLNLSRITGTDLTANIDAVSGAFQRWQTPAEAMPGLLDDLFRASQESGVPIADLATSLGDNKAIFDGLNLSMPDAINLIGSLGKSGVDADTAFAGLKFAMTKMVKEGVEDPKAALDEYFQRIKDAPTDTDAAAVATEIFGKNSIGMASAIRDGTLDVAGFTKAMGDNKNTINDTAAQTDDWKEKLEILRNRIIVAISPALNAMFGGLTDLVDDLQPKLDEFAKWWKEDAEPAIKEFWENAKPVLQFTFEALQMLSEPLAIFLEQATGVFDSVFKIVKGFVDLVAALVHGDWQKVWDSALAIVAGLISGFTSLLQPMMDAGKRLFEAVMSGIESIPIVGNVVSIIWDVIKGALGLAGQFLAIGKAWFGAIWDGIQAVWSSITSWVSSLDIPWPDLTPPWEGMEFPVDVTLVPGELNVDPEAFKSWLHDWFTHKDDAEQLRQQMQEEWQAFLDEHPLEIKPSLVIDVPDFLLRPVPDTKTIPDDSNPFKLRELPDTRPIPDDSNPMKPGDKSKPSLKDLSDPASFLDLVMRAIATIEALADADIAPVSKKKLLALAKGLRSIIVEFSTAMKGIAPETAEAAALVASFLDPILKAIQAGADALAAIGGEGAIPGWPRIKAVVSAIHAATAVAVKELGDLDTSKLEKTAATASLVAAIMKDIASAASDLGTTVDNTKTTTGGGTIGGGTVGGGTVGGGTDTDRLAQVLASFASAIPRVGQRFEGAPGGVSYVVNATYVNPQQPGSIAIDLLEMSMRASAA